MDEIKYFITVNNPAVACMTESRVAVDINYEIMINNYKVARLILKVRGGGCFLYSFRY